MIGRAGPVLVVVVFALLGAYALMPGRARSADADATLFSADRAFEHVRAIAQRPRPIGSDANAEARAYILGQLRNLGVEVHTRSFEVPNYFGEGPPVAVVNVIGRIPGQATTRAVALMAHYDTIPDVPGANDNASAVASLLEAARALVSGPALANDVLLLFTDGEEPAPRYGAAALVADVELTRSVGFIVNLEAVGGSGPSLLVETSGPEGWVVDRYAQAARRPAAFSVVTAVTKLMGNAGTDFDAFRNAGVPGLHFAYMRGSPIYHTAADDIESVSRRSLQHRGDHALALARELGRVDLGDLPDPDASIYFTIGVVLVRHPTSWVLPLLVLTLATCAWMLRRRDGHMLAAGAIAREFGRLAVAGVVALAAGTAGWVALTSVRTTPSLVEAYTYLAALAGLSVALAIWLARRLSKNTRAVVTARAAVLPWLALAIPTSVWMPGASYLFVWPTLAAALTLGWTGSRWRLARYTVIAAPTLLLSVPAIDVFFQTAQPRPGNTDSQLTASFLVPLLLILLVAGLLRSVWAALAARDA